MKSERFERPLRRTSLRIAQALLCALVLAIISGTLLWSQPANAAPRATFYGVPLSSIIAATGTDTSTAAAVTATDTPVAPTETPTPAPPTVTPTSVPSATATPGSTSVLDVKAAASAAGWPQSYSNWCGIATVSLVANYLGHSVSQQAVYNMLADPANQSMWSFPPQSSTYWGPYVPANISGDFGTDPRALAEGMTLATGRLYHAKVDTSGARDTTYHIVHDMLVSRQPISVFVDHGMHSVIVSGVEATGDPLNDPSTITAIHVWDPGGGIRNVGIQAGLEEVVQISTWLSGTIAWSGSSYLKDPYAANVYSGHALDPDPAVGPYAYVSSQVNHLWIGHNVYISPLASADSANLSPDWELNQYGTLIAGLPNNGNWPNLPDGYTGASVPMPSNPPPPPPPVKPPVIAPKQKPLPPPRPTPTPRATATATALPTATTAPTAVPTATHQPKPACVGLSCGIAAVQKDTGLLAITLLLLLMTVMWFPAAIIVARVRASRFEMTKEEMLAALASDDVSPDVVDPFGEQPTGQIDGTLAESSDASLAAAPADALSDLANDIPGGAGMGDHFPTPLNGTHEEATREAANDVAGDTPDDEQPTAPREVLADVESSDAASSEEGDGSSGSEA
ncbi:MAG TPA: hypothetical protein VF040_18980 [Ktedonobacterales bacterium]